MESPKLSTLFKYNSLQRYDGLPGVLKVASQKIKFGVEIEAEYAVDIDTGSFKTVNDYSLKVLGKEYVSKPINLPYMEVELYRLKGFLADASFSKRCSVHSHMNVRDMTVEELYRFILLYLIFERALFKYSGSRNNNPFCIPLYHLSKQTKGLLFLLKTGSIKNVYWNKYTALNLSPIWGSEKEGSKRMGTVEFRHMVGNIDVPYIINWLNLQACLKLASKKIETDELEAHIRTMNTTSGYGWLLNFVFGKFKSLLEYPGVVSDLEEGISDTKLFMKGEWFCVASLG